MIIIRNVFRLKFGKAKEALALVKEGAAPRLMGDKDWQANYQKLGALVDSGYREIFSIVE